MESKQNSLLFLSVFCKLVHVSCFQLFAMGGRLFSVMTAKLWNLLSSLLLNLSPLNLRYKSVLYILSVYIWLVFCCLHCCLMLLHLLFSDSQISHSFLIQYIPEMCSCLDFPRTLHNFTVIPHEHFKAAKSILIFINQYFSK